MKLYELTNEYRAIDHLLNSVEADEESLSLALENIQCEIKNKCISLGGCIKNIEVFAEKMKEAEDSIKERRKIIEKKIEFLKNYVLTNMELSGITKISDPHYDISIRKNPTKVIIANDAELPKEYLRETLIVEPEKKKIKEALEKGEIINGVRLEQSKSLIIK